MPRATLNLEDPDDLTAVQGQWRFAQGLVPGEGNEGLVSQLEGSPARLPDYDDSAWEVTDDLGPVAVAWLLLHLVPNNGYTAADGAWQGHSRIEVPV